MRNIIYIVAVIFVIVWLVGLIGYHMRGAIHLMLVFAVIAVLLNIMQEVSVEVKN
ncbi:lmo0937 family membrane protein [Niastella yeongjuensis]|uniref:lmo0937 family membrane protein n=1 Tax=Niastella yeongjuensis TaxID=354355 RepID=UPI0008B57C14|nr:lmo0937 family membrane protein [Niastella yeongjuensis]SEP21584.1 hypothetical protein SAMN05660816_04808 [Niastella yeongjuensis]